MIDKNSTDNSKIIEERRRNMKGFFKKGLSVLLTIALAGSMCISSGLVALADSNKPVKVHYYSNSNIQLIPDSETSGPAGKTITVSAATIPGYTPDAQSKDYKVTGTNDVVTFYYTANQYTVTFDSQGGTHEDNQTVPYNSIATDPTPAPTKTGYTFDGWYLGDAMSVFDFTTSITGNITLTAHWTINQYTATFVDYDGSTGLGSSTVDYNTAATAPADPSRAGYTFTGWDKDFSHVTSDMTVTATYSINKYTATFVDYDGTGLGTSTVNYNTAATAPSDPSRVGYTFTGWDKVFSHVTSDMTVTATYSINQYTATFVDYDSTGLGSSTVDYNTAATAPSDPSRVGYTFTGWNKVFSHVTSDMTVTATYNINIPNNQTPTGSTPGITIPDNKTPLGSNPTTGDKGTAIPLIAAFASLVTLVGVTVGRKIKKLRRQA